MSLLGIDIGTTGCKAMVFNERGKLLAHSYRSYEIISSQAGYAELDANDVWMKIQSVIHEAAGEVLKSCPVQALSVSSLGEAVVPVSKDRQIIGNSILGSDVRGMDFIRRFHEYGSPHDIYRQTGNFPGTFYSLPKIAWIKEHRPDLYRKTDFFLTWGDFVCFMLGGEPVTNYSLANRTLLFDIINNQWSENIASFAAIDVNKLATAVPSGTRLGTVSVEIAASLNLNTSVSIVSGGHDQCCATLGVGICAGKRSAMYAMGTFLCVVRVFEGMPDMEKMYERKLHIEHHVVPGKYVSFIYNQSGGAMVKWFKENMFADKDSYDAMFAEIPETTAGVSVSAKFGSTGPPDFCPGGKAVFSGLSLMHTRGNLLRAALESEAAYMRDTMDIQKPFFDFDAFVATGGGAISDKWRQITAETLGRQVVRTAVTEASALGAAMIAGVGNNMFASFDEAVEQMVHEQT